ncbi:ATP-binding protein [Streptacidiphilus fuscans]|uniref:ATP-binding protein n=1 Tax=Streptacidiphilus fuscans TaxID=2789292 RepID=A0A931B2T0_9ACTN|nr:ATP-binding protein [Streptacidiphilus fuscans]
MLPLHATWDLESTGEAVHVTRHAITAVLEAWKMTADHRFQALLVYSELATNAVRHGSGQPISVHISLADEELTVEVNDAGRRVGNTAQMPWRPRAAVVRLLGPVCNLRP